jgi:hypothetical protein
MSEFKETVTTKQDQGIYENGAQVQQRTRTVDTEGSSRTTAVNIIWYVVGLIGILLAFRFILKLLGANPSSGFVDFIYTVSGVLTAPFDNIFGVTSTTAGNVDSVFEPSILVAIAVYTLIGWGLTKLLTLNKR